MHRHSGELFVLWFVYTRIYVPHNCDAKASGK